MSSTKVNYPLVNSVRQSPPIDVSIPYDAAWVRGKTFVITGGASGFGAGFLEKWAANGATVIIGDINVSKGDELVRKVRKETGNPNLHFVHCNVTDWQSQVNFFKDAVRLSPHGGIDAVVANAGVSDGVPMFETPVNLDVAEPPKPSLSTIDVNVIGVLYTTHLALFYLPRNPSSTPADPSSDPEVTPRDRHLLLLGSVASLSPIPSQALYGTSKHAVLGLFRTLRSSSFVHGVRVNILCPYWIDTPIIPVLGRVMLAGSPLGSVNDVVDAGTRFAADTRICGRGLVVGPKLKVEQHENGELSLVDSKEDRGEERTAWEVYAHDFEDSEVFARRLVGIMNKALAVRGWIGWVSDIVAAARYGITSWWRR
ncbi:MAG: hypothetical protein M1827_007315 [Pycnora praestabilis]|nr:MAG: hypothetical protein M1827_007315 [Pycnora praestabilis]